MPATAIACCTDRRLPRDRTAKGSRARRRSASSSASVGGSGDVALGLADDAGLRRDVEAHLAAVADHELGRAAADVDHERPRAVVGVALARRAEERQPRLLVAGEDVRLEAEARATSSANSPPLAASRTALVSTASPARRRDRRSACRYSSSVANTRSIASSPRRPSASTPAPSRVTVVRRSSSSVTRPSSISATSSRVEFVPMSTTATRAHDCADLVGQRLAVEPGEQVLDREVGHPLARRPRGGADVGHEIRFGASHSGSSGGSGSGSVTSRAAPAIAPSRRARASAAWSTIGPRAVLIRIAVGCISASAGASIRWRVSGVSGQCSETKSERSSNSSSASPDAARVEHRHLEAGAARRDRPPDPAEADDPERRAVDAVAEVSPGLPGSSRHRAPPRSPRAASEPPPAAARTSGRPSHRSARRACGRPGYRAPMPRRGRCCRADGVVGDRPQVRRGVDSRRRPGRSAATAVPPTPPWLAELGRRWRQSLGPDVDLVRRDQPPERRAGQAAGDEAAGHDGHSDRRREGLTCGYATP